MSDAAANVSVSADFVPTRNPHAHTVELDGEGVVLDEVTNRLHLLNTTATLLWSCFDGTSTLGEICTLVAEAVRVPAAQVLSESSAAVSELLAEGLLVEPGFTAPPRSYPVPEQGVVPEPENT